MSLGYFLCHKAESDRWASDIMRHLYFPVLDPRQIPKRGIHLAIVLSPPSDSLLDYLLPSFSARRSTRSSKCCFQSSMRRWIDFSSSVPLRSKSAPCATNWVSQTFSLPNSCNEYSASAENIVVYLISATGSTTKTSFPGFTSSLKPHAIRT